MKKEPQTPSNFVFRAFGGRKSTMILLAMALVALQNKLGLDDKAIDLIVWLALGGSGALTLESMSQQFGKKG